MAGSVRSWEGVGEELDGTRLQFVWKNQQAVNIRVSSELTNKDNMIKKGKNGGKNVGKYFIISAVRHEYTLRYEMACCAKCCKGKQNKWASMAVRRNVETDEKWEENKYRRKVETEKKWEENKY